MYNFTSTIILDFNVLEVFYDAYFGRVLNMSFASGWKRKGGGYLY